MFEFKHPNYYKELRKRNKSDQAISDEASTEATSVRPGPGLKQQASSSKHQAPSKTTLSKLIRKLNKENAPPGGW